jgi:hypothetical protein
MYTWNPRLFHATLLLYTIDHVIHSLDMYWFANLVS